MELFTGRLPLDEEQRKYCSSLPQLADYPLPAVESQWSCTDLVAQAVGENSIAKLYPINGNDQYGDCTVAWIAHQLTVQNGLAGQKFTPTSQEVVNLYFKLSGGADSGLALTDVLKALTRGALGQQILADCNVNPSDFTVVKKAIRYLGGLFIGFPTTGVNSRNIDQVAQFQNGKPWTVTGNRLQGGHAVIATGYDDSTGMLDILTWGGKQLATYEWWEKYVDEAHAIVTKSLTVFDNETVANLQKAMPALS